MKVILFGATGMVGQGVMCLALVGAMCAQVLLARRQDRELAALDAPAAIPHAA